MLEALKTRFQQLAEGLITEKPTRNALVAERDQLLTAIPPAPENTLEAPEEPGCQCEHCLSRFDEEQRRRLVHGAWAGRVKALDTQLVKLTWGDETERDALGTELAELYAELIRAFDTNRARPWERVVEFDGRGKPLRAYETTAALSAIAADLNTLYRRAQSMVFLSEAELRPAIEETRRAMLAALHRPLRQPLDPDVALRAGTQAGEEGDAAKAGLVPMPGGNLFAGTIRPKKGHA